MASTSIGSTGVTFPDATVQATAAISARNGATTTSSASNVTLTNSSTQIQNITMTTTGLYVILPDATTLTKGVAYFQIYNSGVNNFGIKDSSGNIIGYILAFTQSSIFSLVDNSTTAGTWAVNQDASNLIVAPITASGLSAETVFGNIIQSCLLTATSFIIVYRIGLAVKAIGGTISGATITFGTAITITGTTSDNPQSMSIAKTSSTTCVAAWNAGNNNFKAVSLSLSGTTVSAGTPTTVTSSDTGGIDNSNCYVFSLNNTTAIFVYTATYSSGNTSAVRAGTSSGTTLTLGTAITWSNSNNFPATAPVTSTQIVTAGYINNTGQYTTKIATVSGTTITYGAAFTGTNGGDTGGYNGTSWYMPSAYLTATTALWGNKLITWSGTTISSIVYIPNTCIGSPDSTISGYNYSTDSGATVTKQFNTSASAIAGKVATPYGAGAYKLTGDATNYVGTAINIPTSGGSTGYVGFSLIKVA